MQKIVLLIQESIRIHAQDLDEATKVYPKTM